MARFNALIALVAVLLFLSAVGAKTSSTPRRALKQEEDDDSSRFDFDLDDLKGDFNFGGRGDKHFDFEDYKGDLNFGGNNGGHLLGEGDDFDHLFSIRDGSEFKGLYGGNDKFTGEVHGAFSGFFNEIDSILARYKNKGGAEEDGDNDNGDNDDDSD
ncbi:hypothetical protein Ndes2526B_g02188 [Nannochloris sp. 'desiccata']|nr:hypothetical protein KSW81_003459 [Chlorella desiccata (nom. nud.)]KAH7622903.1 hypothetical protein NADE_007770 [Chlorella desiccata (nom. nud.)]